jgi:hypothetical protein
LSLQFGVKREGVDSAVQVAIDIDQNGRIGFLEQHSVTDAANHHPLDYAQAAETVVHNSSRSDSVDPNDGVTPADQDGAGYAQSSVGGDHVVLASGAVLSMRRSRDQHGQSEHG